jgi:hypothetical protein
VYHLGSFGGYSCAPKFCCRTPNQHGSGQGHRGQRQPTSLLLRRRRTGLRSRKRSKFALTSTALRDSSREDGRWRCSLPRQIKNKTSVPHHTRCSAAIITRVLSARSDVHSVLQHSANPMHSHALGTQCTRLNTHLKYNNTDPTRT